MEGDGGCCRCCLSFILTLGLASLFTWLSLRPDKPKCSIQDFKVPALNKSLNSQLNTTICLLMQLDNPNKDKGIHYDNVSLTLSLLDGSNGAHPIGNATIPEFYQGFNKKAKKPSCAETHGVNWTQAYDKVLSNKTVAFRVDLATAVKYKIVSLYTKRHGLKVGAKVEVNDSGGRVNPKKGIKLTSGVAPVGVGGYCALLGVFVKFLILVFGFA